MTDSNPVGGSLRAPQLAVLGLLCGVSPFATDMYLPAFTLIRRDLHTSASAVQLTLTTFLLGFAVGQLVIGPISDQLGRRRPLLLATAVFAVAGTICAAAPSIWVLVAARFVAGFAGCSGLVIGRAVVADRVSGPAAAKTLSILLTISSLAPVLAPLAGGVSLAPLGWRGIFWLLTGLAVVMFVGAWALLPESLPVERRVAGSAQALRIGGRLLRDRAFTVNVAVYACGFGVMMAYVSASPFVVQNVYGLTAREYSIDFAVNASMLTVTFALNSALVGRVGAVRMRQIGVTLLLLSTALFAGLTLGPDHPPRSVMLLLLALNVAALGFTSSNSTALALARAPHAAGTGSALMGAIQFGFGSAMSPLVGLGGAATAVPMAVVMLACALSANTFALAQLYADRRAASSIPLDLDDEHRPTLIVPEL